MASFICIHGRICDDTVISLNVPIDAVQYLVGTDMEFRVRSMLRRDRKWLTGPVASAPSGRVTDLDFSLYVSPYFPRRMADFWHFEVTTDESLHPVILAYFLIVRWSRERERTYCPPLHDGKSSAATTRCQSRTSALLCV